jgi:uncharacterized protein (TIGR01244 family)
MKDTIMSKAPNDAQRFEDIAVLNLAVPFDGIVTAGQPSPEQLEAFKAAGIATVVNLRQPTETLGFDEQSTVETLGMTYVALPIAGSAGLSEENVRRFADILDSHARPMLVHCGSANRVGALFALDAGRHRGKSVDEAIELGRAAGLGSLEPATRERLNS